MAALKKKPEYIIIVDENVVNNMDENISAILGLESDSLIKLQEGITHAFNFKALEAKETYFVENVSYIELMIKINESNYVKICLGLMPEEAYVQYISTSEDGYVGNYDITKAKKIFGSIKSN